MVLYVMMRTKRVKIAGPLVTGSMNVLSRRTGVLESSVGCVEVRATWHGAYSIILTQLVECTVPDEEKHSFFISLFSSSVIVLRNEEVLSVKVLRKADSILPVLEVHPSTKAEPNNSIQSTPR